MSRIPALAGARPSDEALIERLTAAIDPDGGVTLLERVPSGSGTFPKEVVRCRLEDGSVRALFCKYAAPRDNAHGHRGGIPYEAEVYRRVLEHSAASTPQLVSSYLNGKHGEDWLFLEFLEGGLRLSDSWGEMSKAARWLGLFNREHEGADERAGLSFLIRYDEDYYRGWAHRTAEYAGHWHRTIPWLAPLCDRFAEVVPKLLTGPQTVIHGEYTVHNVMLRDGVIHPTDWESAAIAPGEIDVMCLVDAWPQEIIDACIEAYASARWGGDTPPAYHDRLAAAELYLHFRWLGEHPDLMVEKKRIWRFDRLEVLAERFGLLS